MSYLIVFDEMNLKCGVSYDQQNDCMEGIEDLGPILGKHRYFASSATVFMARGLRSKWKQPVGYMVTDASIPAAILKLLILQCIHKLTDIGLQVMGVVCDQGPNNLSCMRTHLHVSADTPYFIVDDQRVYVIWDTPHLIKNTRNNLRNNGYSVGNHAVTWSHIESFYEQDCKLDVRCAPKLKKNHIDLPNLRGIEKGAFCKLSLCK